MPVTATTERGEAVAELVNEVLEGAGIPGMLRGFVDGYVQRMIDGVDRDPAAARRALAPFIQRVGTAFGFGDQIASHLEGRTCCAGCTCPVAIDR